MLFDVRITSYNVCYTKLLRARGLLSEEDHLLTEILFNPYTYGQVERIRLHLKELLGLIKEKDSKGMQEFLNKVRSNIAEG